MPSILTFPAREQCGSPAPAASPGDAPAGYCHPAHNSSAIPATITPKTNPFRFTFNILPAHFAPLILSGLDAKTGPNDTTSVFYDS